MDGLGKYAISIVEDEDDERGQGNQTGELNARSHLPWSAAWRGQPGRLYHILCGVSWWRPSQEGEVAHEATSAGMQHQADVCII